MSVILILRQKVGDDLANIIYSYFDDSRQKQEEEKRKLIFEINKKNEEFKKFKNFSSFVFLQRQ